MKSALATLTKFWRKFFLTINKKDKTFYVHEWVSEWVSLCAAKVMWKTFPQRKITLSLNWISAKVSTNSFWCNRLKFWYLCSCPHVANRCFCLKAKHSFLLSILFWYFMFVSFFLCSLFVLDKEFRLLSSHTKSKLLLLCVWTEISTVMLQSSNYLNKKKSSISKAQSKWQKKMMSNDFILGLAKKCVTTTWIISLE